MEAPQTMLVVEGSIATLLILSSLVSMLFIAYLKRSESDFRLFAALFGAGMGFLMLLNVILQSIRAL